MLRHFARAFTSRRGPAPTLRAQEVTQNITSPAIDSFDVAFKSSDSSIKKSSGARGGSIIVWHAIVSASYDSVPASTRAAALPGAAARSRRPVRSIAAGAGHALGRLSCRLWRAPAGCARASTVGRARRGARGVKANRDAQRESIEELLTSGTPDGTSGTEASSILQFRGRPRGT